MNTPLPGNTSDTARLFTRPPGYAVGWQDRVILPAPAAGAQWSYTVDGRYWERLVAVKFVFTTSAVVANRFPVLALEDANNTVITAVPGGNSVAASSTLTTYLVNDGPAYAGGSVGNTYGFLPDILVPPGYSWVSQTAAMDVGDAYSGIVLTVHRFPNDTTEIAAGE